MDERRTSIADDIYLACAETKVKQSNKGPDVCDITEEQVEAGRLCYFLHFITRLCFITGSVLRQATPRNWRKWFAQAEPHIYPTEPFLFFFIQEAAAQVASPILPHRRWLLVSEVTLQNSEALHVLASRYVSNLWTGSQRDRSLRERTHDRGDAAELFLHGCSSISAFRLLFLHRCLAASQIRRFSTNPFIFAVKTIWEVNVVFFGRDTSEISTPNRGQVCWFYSDRTPCLLWPLLHQKLHNNDSLPHIHLSIP